MTTLAQYRERMTPENVWPAGHDPQEVADKISDCVDPTAEVLRWASNRQCPMDDMLAAWLVLGVITNAQADETSKARAVETAEFLAAYRANPPQLTAEDLAEMRAAFGPGETVVNVITGQTWTT
jgi:hypothetical protein